MKIAFFSYFSHIFIGDALRSERLPKNRLKRLLKSYLTEGIRKSYGVPTAGFPKEDIASAYQNVMEEAVSTVVKYYVDEYQCSKVALAGGIAANVKLNQRIAELDGVSDVFVYPNMGDGGTATGGALYLLARKGRLQTQKVKDVFYGPSFSNASYWAENEGTSISSNLLRSQVLQEFKLQQYIALNFLQFHFMPKGQYIHFEKNWYVAF